MPMQSLPWRATIEPPLMEKGSDIEVVVEGVGGEEEDGDFNGTRGLDDGRIPVL